MRALLCWPESAASQTLDGIAKGRTDYAATLAARGFLPPWYPQYAAQAGSCGRGAGSISTERSAIAAAEGGPDEYSSNARIIKAALCAGGRAAHMFVACTCLLVLARACMCASGWHIRWAHVLLLLLPCTTTLPSSCCCIALGTQI
jgi:hypothetical protein